MCNYIELMAKENQQQEIIKVLASGLQLLL
uniref:Uncharacterized protein n=1 Tax=Siphoviridae sp. cteRK31 TaxID=2826405 RepID=A0A8S5MKP6_9CAUD|nr:MAG TPA: hypothetical protein [Siphoviridae sp. cteRK31]